MSRAVENLMRLSTHIRQEWGYFAELFMAAT